MQRQKGRMLQVSQKNQKQAGGHTKVIVGILRQETDRTGPSANLSFMHLTDEG